MKRWTNAAAALVAATMVMGGPALAQNDVTRFVVPFGPGGILDIVTRVVAEQLAQSGARETVTLNMPGGAATLGMAEVAVAEPDGKTLGVANTTFIVNPLLQRDVPYDSESLVPVSVMAEVPFVLSVHPSFPPRSVAELLDMLKADPKKYDFSSAGYGSGSHLNTELFMNMTGTEMTHVPFKGGADQIAGSLSGEIDVLFASLPAALQFVETGQMIPLAITAPERDPRMPDVPTMMEALQETGSEGYAMSEFTALVAPPGTPKEVIDELGTEIQAALSAPEARDRIEAIGGTVVGNSPEEAAAYLESARERWQRTISEQGIKIE